jgi:CRP-like cAMP-binding protein
MQILQVAKIDKYDVNNIIATESNIKEKFCVIMQGVVSVEHSNKKGRTLKKFFSTGDFFGESLVVKDDIENNERISIVAMTQVEIGKGMQLFLVDIADADTHFALLSVSE